jgi:hypothetical protein
MSLVMRTSVECFEIDSKIFCAWKSAMNNLSNRTVTDVRAISPLSSDCTRDTNDVKQGSIDANRTRVSG